MFETERQYWQLIELGEKMKTLDRYIQMVDTLHKEVNAAFQSGLIIRNDLLKVELKQTELQMNRLKLENGIVLSKMALCQLIGISYNQSIRFAENPISPDNPQMIYTDHQLALTKRSEYQLLQKSTETEKYQTKMLLGEYMPQLGVGVGAMYLDVLDGKSSTAGMVFGSVNIPLSGWWEGSHKMKERRLKEEQNRNTVADNIEKLLLQMQQARNALDEAYQQMQLAKISIRQAEVNLKVCHDNYAAGILNVSDLLEAQAIAQSSKENMISIQCNYQVAKARYLQLTGMY